MFIRPMGVTVRPANRPPGHPLLRGLLARASGAAKPAAGSAGAGEPAVAGPVGLVGPAEPPPGAPPEPPQPADPEPSPSPAIPPDHSAAPGTAPSAGLVAELTQLAGLAREGLLTPQEFATAKARLLRG
ncbi:SHOCT domain-containing protein [Streptomyces xanthophaeus]|uniref:SHOCT domain-containing protein n=1 Tax=Streptomyces xanthophaeus TaxID=67385 RepID=UPI002648D21E|nr:SHOCT domain-containing protein [Streptomyces xanthophaeus]WKD32610.1 SHOCT domain-containing protein [Streptomyces xanthophaeus]